MLLRWLKTDLGAIIPPENEKAVFYNWCRTRSRDHGHRQIWEAAPTAFRSVPIPIGEILPAGLAVRAFR
jgi:hypothetical protein